MALSTLIPLVKDQLGDDITSSNNYRSIALNSLILKEFDWVVLLLHRNDLKIDELQFGFQQDTSNQHVYLEKLSSIIWKMVPVYLPVSWIWLRPLTRSNIVNFSGNLWKTVFHQFFIRLLLEMYEKQQANVRWNGVVSNWFSRDKWSKTTTSTSMASLLVLGKRKQDVGWMALMFESLHTQMSCCYSHQLNGLQEMTKTCEDYGNIHNLTFSTDLIFKKCKTKCLAFLKKERNLKNIKLKGRNLPWVDAAKHLGCRIGPKNRGFTRDLMGGRTLYITKVNELNQEFYYAHPLTKVQINNIFNTDFYGSQLRDLFSAEANRLENTWNISQRIMLGIHRNTHRLFIEPLTETQHIKFSLLKRFVNFVNSIESSTKHVLRNMLEIVKHDLLKTSGLREAYNKQRNYCVTLLRKTNMNFYGNLKPNIISDNMKFWKHVKPFFSDKLSTNSKITLMEKVVNLYLILPNMPKLWIIILAMLSQS